MVKLEPAYAYSNPSLSKPDLRITLRLLTRSRISISARRIRGTGDVPGECWLSQVNFMILDSVWTRANAELTRTEKQSPDSFPVKLIFVPEGFKIVVAPGSTAPPSLRLASKLESRPPHIGRSEPKRGGRG